jgi:hypothetical protein
MKTLRDEWKRLYPHEPQRPEVCKHWPVAERFLDEYGSYRVVEGVLVLTASGSLVAVEVGDEDLHYDVDLGAPGDHVKLLLPPEEKEEMLDGAREQILEAQLNATRGREFAERDRADKYKKALREIGGTSWPMLAAQDGVRLLRKIAREALDEDAKG